MRVLLAVFPCFFALKASAHHFHYVQIEDTRYAPNTLFDLFGEDPLERWIVYTGNDEFSIFNDPSYGVSDGFGSALAVWDFPYFDDVTDPTVTAYVEFEVDSLPGSGDNGVAQTIEVGFTDLATQVKWDEAQGTMSGTKSGLGRFTVNNIPSWNQPGAGIPVIVRLYYHLHDWVFTGLVTDPLDTPLDLESWAATSGTTNPFTDFYPFPGTNPDDLDIYFFAKCEDVCGVTVLDWGRLNCYTAGGAVDFDNCDKADLAVTVDDGETTAAPGQSLTYVITASNTGLEDEGAPTVTDEFPAELACFWTCAASGGASCTAGPVAGDVVDSPNLPRNSQAVYTATCTLDPGASGVLVDTATISGGPDLDLTNNSATDSDLIAPYADLGITNDDSRATATPGGSVTYAINATNFGPVDVLGAAVHDSFSASLGCDWSCFPTGGASCTALGSGDIDESVDLPVGATASFLATCDIDPAATGALINAAGISPPAGIDDPFAGNDGAVDSDLLTPQADLEISKDDGQTEAVPGGQVIYTIVAGNPVGPSYAPGSLVADSFSGLLSDCNWACVAGGGGSCTAGGTGAIADVADLPVGATATYTATCTIDPGATGLLSNTATIAAGTGVSEVAPSDNSFTDEDTLTPEADLRITKTDGMTLVMPGDELIYSIVASNDGPSDALASDVEDLVPAELTDCSWTCSPDPGALCTGGPVSGDLVDSVDLPAGAEVTYTLDCIVVPSWDHTAFSNTATIATAAGVTEIDPGDNSATDTDFGTAVIFMDGFESGDTSAWTQTVP